MYRLDILCESFFFLFRRKRRAEEFCIDSDRREINCSLRPQIHFRFWFLISLSFDFWFAYKTFSGTTIVLTCSCQIQYVLLRIWISIGLLAIVVHTYTVRIFPWDNYLRNDLTCICIRSIHLFFDMGCRECYRYNLKLWNLSQICRIKEFRK